MSSLNSHSSLPIVTAKNLLNYRLTDKDYNIKPSRSLGKLNINTRTHKFNVESTAVLKIYNEIPSLQSKIGSLTSFLNPEEFSRCTSSLPDNLKFRSVISDSASSAVVAKHKLYITMNEELSSSPAKDPAAINTEGNEDVRENIEDPNLMLLYDAHAINRRRAATIIRDNIVEEIKGTHNYTSDHQNEAQTIQELIEDSPRKIKLPALKMHAASCVSLSDKLDSVISVTSKIFTKERSEPVTFKKQVQKEVHKSELDEGKSFESMILRMNRSLDRAGKEEKMCNGDIEDLLDTNDYHTYEYTYITQTLIHTIQGLKSIHRQTMRVQLPLLKQEINKLIQDKLEVLPKSIMRKRVVHI